MTQRIVNLDELQFRDWGHGEKYEARLGSISRRLGAEQLGYNLTILPPGKRAFPMHSHRVSEEMFFILEGEGEVRLGDETHPLRAGDVLACPAGGPETAHQIINTGTGEMRYLAVSTRSTTEIAEYPDSQKIGIYGEFAGASGEGPTTMRFIVRDQAGMADYWDGE